MNIPDQIEKIRAAPQPRPDDYFDRLVYRKIMHGMEQAEAATSTHPQMDRNVATRVVREAKERSGLGHINALFLRALMDDIEPTPTDVSFDELTPRHRQAAEAFAVGITVPEIAEAMSIKPASVRQYIVSAYRFLRIGSAYELVNAYAAEYLGDDNE